MDLYFFTGIALGMIVLAFFYVYLTRFARRDGAILGSLVVAGGCIVALTLWTLSAAHYFHTRGSKIAHILFGYGMILSHMGECLLFAAIIVIILTRMRGK